MRSSTKNLIALGIAVAVALKLFIFGLSYSLEFRIRGDAYTYLEIADSFTDFSAVLAFAGDRTVGFPFFESIIGSIASLLTSSNDVLIWVNTICVVLFITHIVTAWLFSQWARSTKLIQSTNMVLVLFFLFATYPALIGHTTSPLSDTLAIDLIVYALISMQIALTASSAYKAYLLAGLSAFFFGFSILVRPGNLWSIAAALMAGIALSLLTARRKAAVVCVAALGCALVLAPYYYNCAQKYGTLCLQSPKTFNVLDSAQAGLRGARTLWQKGNLVPGQIPVLPDPIMSTNYNQCHLKTIIGMQDSSLSGCLLRRPFILPAYIVKKWVGLFDHFRFTPYLEEDTPFWLKWLSRAYDSLAWVGLCMLFMTLFKTAKPKYRSEIRDKLTVTPLILVVYSLSMLAQHTLLHVEDRYGFPILPLCLLMLVIYSENFIQNYRIFGYQGVLPAALYCITAWTIFIVQIIIWDNTVF